MARLTSGVQVLRSLLVFSEIACRDMADRRGFDYQEFRAALSVNPGFNPDIVPGDDSGSSHGTHQSPQQLNAYHHEVSCRKWQP